MADHRHVPDGLYPMRVVTRLTGLTADTIRAWQRRHGAITPARTSGRARRFSGAEVRRLIRLRDATRLGHAIGAIARLPDAALDQLGAGRALDAAPAPPAAPAAPAALAAPAAPAAPAAIAAPAAPPLATDPRLETVRQEYLEALRRFDLRATRDRLTRAAALLPPYDFVFELALPLLREVGARWERGELGVAHEHAATEQLKAVILTLLRLPAPHPGAPRLLATTPPGHRHELGAVTGAFLAALRGFDAVFIGADLPEADLVAALEHSGASLLLLSVARATHPDEHRELARLVRRAAARCEVLVGIALDNPGRRVLALPGVRLFDDFRDFDAALTAWRR